MNYDGTQAWGETDDEVEGREAREQTERDKEGPGETPRAVEPSTS